MTEILAILCVIWCLIGIYTCIRYGDLWTMFVTMPLYMVCGLVGLIYHLIKDYVDEYRYRK